MLGWTRIVTLTHRKTGQQANVFAHLEETRETPLRDRAVEFPWSLTIDDTVTYPDGTWPAQGDTISFTRRPDLPPVSGILGRSHPSFATLMATTVFLFKERD